LSDGILGFAWLFYFDEDGRLIWWMAKCEIRATFACLIFWPNRSSVPGIPAEFLKKAKNDALRDRLLIGESSLAESRFNISKGSFYRHLAPTSLEPLAPRVEETLDNAAVVRWSNGDFRRHFMAFPLDRRDGQDFITLQNRTPRFVVCPGDSTSWASYD
jgi:hypothetical protein